MVTLVERTIAASPHTSSTSSTSSKQHIPPPSPRTTKIDPSSIQQFSTEFLLERLKKASEKKDAESEIKATVHLVTIKPVLINHKQLTKCDIDKIREKRVARMHSQQLLDAIKGRVENIMLDTTKKCVAHMPTQHFIDMFILKPENEWSKTIKEHVADLPIEFLLAASTKGKPNSLQLRPKKVVLNISELSLRRQQAIIEICRLKGYEIIKVFSF